MNEIHLHLSYLCHPVQLKVNMLTHHRPLHLDLLKVPAGSYPADVEAVVEENATPGDQDVKAKKQVAVWRINAFPL